MNKYHDWSKLKIKFFTKDYESLRDFAEKEGIPYGSNFCKHTKGWVSEKAAVREQISRKIAKIFIEKEFGQIYEMNENVLLVNKIIIDIIQGFAINKDYCKFAFRHRGKPGVDIVETSYIKMSELEKAANAISKIAKIIEKAHLALPASCPPIQKGAFEEQ